jgi:TPR repeat protein
MKRSFATLVLAIALAGPAWAEGAEKNQSPAATAAEGEAPGTASPKTGGEPSAQTQSSDTQAPLETTEASASASKEPNSAPKERVESTVFVQERDVMVAAMPLTEVVARAEAGEVLAQNELGIRYRDGEDVDQDFPAAIAWFQKAAEQGETSAMLSLAVMYAAGQGVTQDYGPAFKWYRLAAEQGAPQAMVKLGIMYAAGQGTTQDNLQAHVWLNLALARLPEDDGFRQSIALLRERLQLYMTPEEVEKAQARARNWVSPQVVKEVQYGLAELDYDPGPPDGIVGPATRDAIIAFERDHGLPETGKTSPELSELIADKRKVMSQTVAPAAGGSNDAPLEAY